jgi:hypothetical protein
MAWKGRRAERAPIERRDLVGADWPRVTKVAELERAAPQGRRPLRIIQRREPNS